MIPINGGRQEQKEVLKCVTHFEGNQQMTNIFLMLGKKQKFPFLYFEVITNQIKIGCLISKLLGAKEGNKKNQQKQKKIEKTGVRQHKQCKQRSQNKNNYTIQYNKCKFPLK